MKILAVDPGFGRIGVAVLEKEKKEILLFSTCIETNPKAPLADRLKHIGQEIKTVIKKWQPTELAIEKLFFAKNVTTALSVAEAKGVIIYEAVSSGLEIFEYDPVKIKQVVTGSGRADKTQVTKMTKLILSINSKKRLDDEYDAMAVGLTHLAMRSHRQIIHK